MRYIDMSGDGGTHWKNFAIRKENKRLGIPPPRYDEEGKPAHNGLREALARRQGFLCGFCMGHLSCWDKAGNFSWGNVKVAHLEPQNLTKEQKDKIKLGELDKDKEKERLRKLGINIKNMVLACKGETNGVFHCDTHQKNRHVTISFDNRGLMDEVYFPQAAIPAEIDTGQGNSTKSASGLLVKGPENWQKQIGTLEVKNDKKSFLNLNNKILCRIRQKVLEDFVQNLVREDKWNNDNYRKWISVYSTPGHKGRLPAYCQVIVRALEKRIK